MAYAYRCLHEVAGAVAAVVIVAGNLGVCEQAAEWALPSDHAALQYLASVMDRYHKCFYVYDDYLSAGNHFVERALMCNAGDEESVPPMTENWTNEPASGLTCIRCDFRARRGNWGGWMFVNGALLGTNSSPTLNWGEVREAGVSLKGATRLAFRARGEQGGEKVKFFAFGIGRVGGLGKPHKPFPDSAPQATTGWIELSKEWKEYEIGLQGLDLTNVLLGFAWMTKASINAHRDIVFFLDDIHYDLSRLDRPRFLVSYETSNSGDDFDLVLRNTAFVYDNAVAMLAFLAAGNVERAGLIADAFLYAQQNDRYYSDGRLRNAYQGGDLALPPGWRPNGRKGAVRLPGWWDASQKRWLEDATMAGTYAGNMAWAMLALMSYYEAVGDPRYLQAAKRMGEWIEKHCRDERGAGGYTAGYEGWEPQPERLLYKATEHNVDLAAAFSRLAELSGEDVWRSRAERAQRFVYAMWDPGEGKFWTGTGDDGVTVFRDVVPLDVQAWSQLALRAAPMHALRAALSYAERNCMVGEGFDFNQDADGVWFEGHAQMACAYVCAGQPTAYRNALEFLRRNRQPSGAMLAADRDYTSTGFYLRDGTPWVYYRRPHVAATAWYVLAERRQNPFYLDLSAGLQLAQSQRESPAHAE
jgi:hypothetical protein